MADIVSIGEMLIDFTEDELENGDPVYRKNPGGAPANVAVMASKLGVPTSFIGKAGKDIFGEYLKQVLESHGVDTSGFILDKKFNTTLAFVGKNEEGNREFVFYRKDAADINLNYKEVKLKLIDKCRLLHFGSLMLTSEPSKSAAIMTVEYAKQKGKIISYDPNWREKVWESKTKAIKAIQSVLPLADIVKVSEDELRILSDCENMLPGIAQILKTGVKIICITQGAKGCIVATRQGIERLRTFKVNTVDTLGAGDSFFGAFLARLVQSGKALDEIGMEDLKDFALYANACGSLSSTKPGAIPAMPTDAEIRDLIANGTMI